MQNTYVQLSTRYAIVITDFMKEAGDRFSSPTIASKYAHLRSLS